MIKARLFTTRPEDTGRARAGRPAGSGADRGFLARVAAVGPHPVVFISPIWSCTPLRWCCCGAIARSAGGHSGLAAKTGPETRALVHVPPGLAVLAHRRGAYGRQSLVSKTRHRGRHSPHRHPGALAGRRSGHLVLPPEIALPGPSRLCLSPMAHSSAEPIMVAAGARRSRGGRTGRAHLAAVRDLPRRTSTPTASAPKWQPTEWCYSACAEWQPRRGMVPLWNRLMPLGRKSDSGCDKRLPFSHCRLA